MFKEILQSIIDKMNGEAEGAILMDKEGIKVEKVETGGKLDIETVAMEYSVVLKDVFKAASMVGAGPVQELIIKTQQFSVLLRILDETYFVGLFIKAGGNVGRGRYVLRTAAAFLKEQL